MKDFIEIIPVEYFVLHKAMLAAQLAEMPVIRAGTHSGRPVYRIYDSNRLTYSEMSLRSKNWDRYTAIFTERNRIENMLKQTEQILERYHVKISSIPQVWNTNNKYGCEFFDSLEDGSCSVENESEYFHNGKHFRSRSEMLFAAVLDEFGLEYKHDVKVKVMGKMITFDFAIIFREFNRCIFIEYYGMCNDPEYNRKNARKLECSMSSGIYLGRDLFVLSGDVTYTPGSDIIRIAVVSIIAQVTCFHLSSTQRASTHDDNRPSQMIRKQVALQKSQLNDDYIET